MRFRVLPLLNLAWQHPPAYLGRELLTLVLLALLLTLIAPQPAAARTAPRRDRRSDREITLTYAHTYSPSRRFSGFATSDRRESPSSQRETANSTENARPPSNKNDEQPPVRGTLLRLAR